MSRKERGTMGLDLEESLTGGCGGLGTAPPSEQWTEGEKIKGVLRCSVCSATTHVPVTKIKSNLTGK